MNKINEEQKQDENQAIDHKLSISIGAFIWENNVDAFNNSELLYIGRWVVGEVCYESLSKNENYFAAKSMLPGLKRHLYYYKTKEEAKSRVEAATKRWLIDLAISSAKEQKLCLKKK